MIDNIVLLFEHLIFISAKPFVEKFFYNYTTSEFMSGQFSAKSAFVSDIYHCVACSSPIDVSIVFDTYDNSKVQNERTDSFRKYYREKKIDLLLQ